MTAAARAEPCDAPCHDGASRLRNAYLSLLEAALPDVDELRQLFFADAWYRTEVRRIAIHLVRRNPARRDDVDDLVHDALVQLAADLERQPDLHLDRARSAADFAAWLRSIIRRHCLQALRVESRHARRRGELDEALDAEIRTTDHRLLAEATELLDLLPEPQRTVLKLFFDKTSCVSIARRLGLSRRRVGELIASGVDRLRKAME